MKKINFMRGAALALVAVFSFGPAQAATTGVLNFGGAVGFDGSLGSATALTFGGAFTVTSATDDFSAAGIDFNSNGTMADLTFSPFTPTVALMSIDGFAFTLETLEVGDQSDSFLSLSGTGTLTANGDSTDYSIAMSVDAQGSLSVFSGTLRPAPRANTAASCPRKSFDGAS